MHGGSAGDTITISGEDIGGSDSDSVTLRLTEISEVHRIFGVNRNYGLDFAFSADLMFGKDHKIIIPEPLTEILGEVAGDKLATFVSRATENGLNTGTLQNFPYMYTIISRV